MGRCDNSDTGRAQGGHQGRWVPCIAIAPLSGVVGRTATQPGFCERPAVLNNISD